MRLVRYATVARKGSSIRLPRDWRAALLFALAILVPSSAHATGNLRKLKHVIILMQENRSFDSYLGTLPYAAGTPYHPGPCRANDHACVDGLTCSGDPGALNCSNSNPDDDGSPVLSFHQDNYCISDLDHSWPGSHAEANFRQPANTLAESPNDGFVRTTKLPNPALGAAVQYRTMGYHDDSDLPFYYSLAETFGIDDRYFSSAMGPTASNRFFLMAGTAFGHVDTSELRAGFRPPPGPGLPSVVIPYEPITGSIFALMDQFNVSWADYYTDIPQSVSFIDSTRQPDKLVPINQFFADAASGRLPQVSFVESKRFPSASQMEADEHPPADIRAGQFFVSQVVNAVRNGPSWKDSIIFVTYDEAGGFFDHVSPPRAPQKNAATPDGIYPGQCADLSDVPNSRQPGGGARCAVSLSQAEILCPALAQDPTGPYPADCPAFEQYGFRVPLIAVSAFSKRHYVSHTLADHASLLALIEKRFIGQAARRKQGGSLTQRDLLANTLEDLFDFDRSPSRKVQIPPAPAPVPGEHGCP